MPGADRRLRRSGLTRFALVIAVAVVAASLSACTANHAASPTPARGAATVVTPPPDKDEQHEAVRTSAPTVADAPRGGGLMRVAGRIVFAFSRDMAGTASCYRECAAAWLPVIAQGGKPHGTGAVGTDSIGSIRRTDGVFQVTYGGHPLYYPQSASSRTRPIHSFGGVWSPVHVTREQSGG